MIEYLESVATAVGDNDLTWRSILDEAIICNLSDVAAFLIGKQYSMSGRYRDFLIYLKDWG